MHLPEWGMETSRLSRDWSEGGGDGTWANRHFGAGGDNQTCGQKGAGPEEEAFLL